MREFRPQNTIFPRAVVKKNMGRSLLIGSPDVSESFLGELSVSPES